MTLRLVQIAGGILIRGGRTEDAERLLDAYAREQDDLVLSASPDAQRNPARRAGRRLPGRGHGGSLSPWPGRCAGGGGQFSLALTRLSLRLRPGFTPALLLASDALLDERQYEAALGLLNQIPGDDPLGWGSPRLRRAAVLDRLDRPDEAAVQLQAMAATLPTASRC